MAKKKTISFTTLLGVTTLLIGLFHPWMAIDSFQLYAFRVSIPSAAAIFIMGFGIVVLAFGGLMTGRYVKRFILILSLGIALLVPFTYFGMNQAIKNGEVERRLDKTLKEKNKNRRWHRQFVQNAPKIEYGFYITCAGAALTLIGAATMSQKKE